MSKKERILWLSILAILIAVVILLPFRREPEPPVGFMPTQTVYQNDGWVLITCPTCGRLEPLIKQELRHAIGKEEFPWETPSHNKDEEAVPFKSSIVMKELGLSPCPFCGKLVEVDIYHEINYEKNHFVHYDSHWCELIGRAKYCDSRY